MSVKSSKSNNTQTEEDHSEDPQPQDTQSHTQNTSIVGFTLSDKDLSQIKAMRTVEQVDTAMNEDIKTLVSARSAFQKLEEEQRSLGWPDDADLATEMRVMRGCQAFVRQRSVIRKRRVALLGRKTGIVISRAVNKVLSNKSVGVDSVEDPYEEMSTEVLALLLEAEHLKEPHPEDVILEIDMDEVERMRRKRKDSSKL